MSRLKAFLERRSKALLEKRSAESPPREERQQVVFDDERFWQILRQVKEESTASGVAPEDVLLRILEAYSDEEVAAFVKMYERLAE